MGYRIRFDDLTTIHATTSQSFSQCGEVLNQFGGKMTTFMDLSSLKGKAAESMKSYLQEVHGTLLASIGELITEYQVRFLLYKDDMFQFDNDLHAELDEATFDSLLSFFPGSQNEFQNEARDLKSTVDTISDLISEYGPSDANVNNDYAELIHSITTLREDVGTCEHTHASNDLTSFKELLTSFEGLVSSYMGRNKSVAINYRSGSIANIPAAQRLNKAYQNSQAGRVDLENKIKGAAARDEKRFALLEKEAADARMDQGIWQAIGALATVVVGAVAIVATAGMATPLVVTAIVAGSASMAYGVSNLAEAGQNIYYGSQGDATTLAINPLRDTVFMGNQQAYDIFGFTATFVAGSMIPIGSAYKVFGSVNKAIVSGVSRSAITTGSSLAANKIATPTIHNISKKLGADDRTARNLAQAGGTLASIYVGSKVYKAVGQYQGPKVDQRHYSELKDSKSVGPGKDFTLAQKNKIIELNKARNGGVVKSDKSGEVLVRPKQSQKGITPPDNEWQIDHVQPKSKGGSNSYENAQVLSRKENMTKLDNIDNPTVKIPLPNQGGGLLSYPHFNDKIDKGE